MSTFFYFFYYLYFFYSVAAAFSSFVVVERESANRAQGYESDTQGPGTNTSKAFSFMSAIQREKLCRVLVLGCKYET